MQSTQYWCGHDLMTDRKAVSAGFDSQVGQPRIGNTWSNEEYGDRRSISCFTIGQTAAFGPLEAAYLIERGFVVEVKPDTTDEEAA
jgi:hypothetical protein